MQNGRKPLRRTRSHTSLPTEGRLENKDGRERREELPPVCGSTEARTTGASRNIKPELSVLEEDDDNAARTGEDLPVAGGGRVKR